MPNISTEQRQIEDRLARLQLSLDPAVLWADIGRESLDAALQEIARVTRKVLGGARASLRVTAAGDTPRALGVAAFISGMGPLLGLWIADGRLDADPEEQALLGNHYDHGCRRYALLQERLVALLDALRAHAITPIVLKGMDTAQRYFPTPGSRTIGDIDILIHPAGADQAHRVLAARGFVEKPASGQPSRSEWMLPESQTIHSLELNHADNPWAVDLHVALERYYHRGLVASLGARAFDAVPFAVAGRSARALAQPALVAWLAIHTGYGLDHLQFVRLVELVFVIRKDVAAGVLSWDELDQLLRETATTRFAYPALALAEHLAPGTVPPGILARGAAASSVRARRVVASLAASGSYRLARRSLDDRLMWARGPLQLLLLTSDLVWPAGSAGLRAIGRLYQRRIRAVLAGQVSFRASSDTH